jgi:hypothetical protein
MKDSVRQKLANRLIGLWWVVALGLIAGLLLSPKLWVSTRTYPLTPLFGLPPLPYPVDYLLFGLFGVLLVGAAVVRGKAAALLAAAALGLTLLFVLEDLSRLQPWFYQYSFMLAALCLYGWRRLGAEGALNACRLIIAGTYFWSGLQKANASFVGEVYPWLVEPIVERLPAAAWWTDALLMGAYAVPAVEAGIGLGLLVPRFRTPAIVVALAMHAFILFCLGPWGHDWNSVVWPWNVAMGAFVVVLFWRPPDEPSLLAVLKPERGPWLGTAFRAATLVLFAIAPILSFFGLWHSYLSSSLYSGNIKQGYLLTYDASGFKSMDIVDLSLKEMNVPAYPEKRVFKNVFAARCGEVGFPEPILLVRGTPDIFSGERSEEVYRCDEVHHIS